MIKLIVFSSTLLISTFSAQATGDCDISGIWSHSAKPAKLVFDLSKGEASIYAHDDNAQAIGLVVLKGIQPAAISSSWQAKMYSADKDSFVAVQITAKGCHQLSVDFRGEEVLALVR